MEFMKISYDMFKYTTKLFAKKMILALRDASVGSLDEKIRQPYARDQIDYKLSLRRPDCPN